MDRTNSQLIRYLEAYGRYVEDGVPAYLLKGMAEKINGMLAAETVIQAALYAKKGA